MRSIRTVACFGLVLAMTVAGGGTAVAVAPGNDTYAGRTVIGSLPFQDHLDTTEATTDPDDAELAAQCGAQATDASVWYEVTAPVDGGLVIRTFDSLYSTTAIVATGGPGNWTVVGCTSDLIDLPASAGTTYTILVVDDQFDEVGNGGSLLFSIDIMDVTVNRLGTFDSRTGSATVSGTVFCTDIFGGAEVNFMQTTLTQRAGRVTGSTFVGSEADMIVCDGTRRPWSLEVVPESGRFAGGQAASVTTVFACGEFGCGTDTEETIVLLRRKS